MLQRRVELMIDQRLWFCVVDRLGPARCGASPNVALFTPVLFMPPHPARTGSPPHRDRLVRYGCAWDVLT